MGRKAYQPTDKDRSTVLALAGYGIQHKEIAVYLEIDYKTLLKYFRKELDSGMTKANASVMRNLHRLASTSDNPSAAIFWGKTRMGMREKEPMADQSGRDTEIHFVRGETRKSQLASEETPKNGTEDE